MSLSSHAQTKSVTGTTDTMTQKTIRLFFQNTVHDIQGHACEKTLLQYLRTDLHCTGTKEACAEGDCGACTVVIGELVGDEVQMKSVNSCIQLLPSLDGKAVFSVEDLKQDGSLHPVQQALVDCHGSQCGFCTPGFVMSLWDLYLRNEDSTAPLQRAAINEALSGNLCRCTGYRPIIDAAHKMLTLPRKSFQRDALKQSLRALQRPASLNYQHGTQSFYAPQKLAELLTLRATKPAATLLAGSTDVGLWVTKQFRDLGDIIYLGKVRELQRIVVKAQTIEIGAGVSLNDAYRAMCEHYPQQLTELWQRFASLPIRNVGTLGGNVANGSPIGDSMPWLIALNATLSLQSVRGERRIPLDQFYLAYQKKDLLPDEIVASIQVPLPTAQRIFRTYKLSKRYDQDISAVCAAFSASFDGETLKQVRVVFGGMAGIPQRAHLTEALLENKAWTQATLNLACLALARDFTPLDDMRASKEYRVKTAQNLLRRFWLETRPSAPLAATALNVFAHG